MDPTKPLPTFEKRKQWKEQPRWTTKPTGEGTSKKSTSVAWTREGKLRFIEIVNHLINERSLDKEKGDDSREMAYMKKMKTKLEGMKPKKKRIRLSRDENDVEMPIVGV